MKVNKKNERRLFCLGLLFITIAYSLIQCINNFSIISNFATDMFSTLKPFLVAFLISYILYPIVKLVENKLKIKRFYSVLLTYLFFISCIGICINFILPMLTSSISSLIQDLPQYLSQIQVVLTDISSNLNINVDFDIVKTINKAILDILPNIKDFLAKSVTSALGTTVAVFSSIFDIFVTIVASFYILLEHESFISSIKLVFKKLLKENTYTTLSNITQSLHLNIGKYLLGKSINSVFVATIAFIGLSILKSNYAGLLAILFGIMNMIPLIGPIIGTGVAVVFNIFTSFTKGIIILIFLLILQQIESFILEPKTIGKSLDLNGFTTLLSISIFGQLFGMVGMILGIPIMSIIKKYLSKLLDDEQTIA